jgi:hypothetical protein
MGELIVEIFLLDMSKGMAFQAPMIKSVLTLVMLFLSPKGAFEKSSSLLNSSKEKITHELG